MTGRETPVKALYGLADRNRVPLNMMLELTYRCNERCLHCYLPETQGIRPPRPGDELKTGEWLRVLGEMAEAGTFYLILSGGEVLLRSDLGSILSRARELSFAVEIFTNAVSITPEIADFWAELGISGVGVSVYSPDPAGHDQVTRRKGSFERTIRGVRLLRERDVRVRFKTPMMRRNLGRYGDLAALAREMGVTCNFDPVMTPRNDGSDIPAGFALGERELEAVYRDPRFVRGDGVLRAGPMDLERSTCSAGATSGAIGPYGDVTPCVQWAVSGGNVREKPFAEIWKSGAIFSTARTVTAKDLKACSSCGQDHYVHCLGLSELEKGDALVPDSSSCRITRAMKEVQAAAKARG